ncbi:uncharacterized protein EI90DRAFT_3294168 [Cantharellus anzutake]|uniref:uncharacterized protein n=1 Tax=Cantharellus anzutake TaxID=1750568 RepID=UPI0019088FE8|nr:uncharacterized protein EI90DRAFT_3294168 [Cantharellus anzutake]KAF8314612.1 hypothetical protein EI90DRAFT_3294168 [Cantharellus anzutake]
MGMSFRENLQGGYLCGLVLETILLGVITVQVFLYYHRFPKDHICLKSTVGFLWLVQMFQVTAATASLYRAFIHNFDTLPSSTIWYDTFYQISTVICSTIVQLYFVLRLYRFGGSIWLPMLVALLTLGQVGTGLEISATVLKASSDLPWLTLEAVADLVIAFSMSYFLQKRRTGFRQTDTVLRTLTVYAINTGLLTSILALAVMFAVWLFPVLPMYLVALTAYIWVVCLLRLPLHPLDLHRATRRCLYSVPFGKSAFALNTPRTTSFRRKRDFNTLVPPSSQDTQPDKCHRLAC